MNALIIFLGIVFFALIIWGLILTIQCLSLFVEAAKLYLKDNEKKLLLK